MIPDSFWTVFDVPNVAWATGAGFASGATFLVWLNLRYPPLVRLSAGRHFVLTFAVSALLFAIFWVSQLAEAVLSDDPQLPRIVARLCLSLLFAMAMAAGLALGVWRAEQRSRQEVR